MFRMKQNVIILSSKKMNGSYNIGKIIGIEYIESDYHLGYMNKSEYYNRFTVPKFKVAYIDCVTNRAGYEWFLENELTKELQEVH